MSYCLIFPGQGTQFAGMAEGLDLYGQLDSGLLSLMSVGPKEELDKTINAQPAIFATSLALWKEAGLESPDFVMGHSLGEYMAMVVSGVFSFDDALALVNKRAYFMAQAQPDGSSGMSAVLGLSADEVESAIRGISNIWVANINSGNQIVISGMRASIEKAAPRLKSAGARRIIPLKVSVASHCPLMDEARDKLRDEFSTVRFNKPGVRIVFNASAKEEIDPDKIRSLLAMQLVSPVLWDASVRYVLSQGITKFLEIGPRSVLAPLIKRISPPAEVVVRTQK